VVFLLEFTTASDYVRAHHYMAKLCTVRDNMARTNVAGL